MKNIIISKDDIEIENKGSFFKFWLTLNDEKVLFKENSPYAFSDYGEVLYTTICNQFNVNCVQSEFATCNFKEDEYPKTIQGVIIKNFLKNEYEFSINYTEILEDIIFEQDIDCMDNYKIENIVNNVQKYAKLKNFKFSKKKLSQQLLQMFIIDHFLSQSDRNLSNIEFIADSYTLKLAPIFDNGLCLTFDFTSQEIIDFYEKIQKDNEYDYYNGANIFVSTFKRDKVSSKLLFKCALDKRYKNDYADILNACSKNKSIKKLVLNILNLDLSQVFEKMEKYNGQKLPQDVKKSSIILFKRKKQLLLKYDKSLKYNLFTKYDKQNLKENAL